MNSSSVPLISVVLPVYNVEKYIKEALQSIFNQTFQNFEIIIIDDCSTDNTLKEIDFFKDNRIKIIKKSQNKGLIDSLNIGFAQANGKYIARMDGDDVSRKERFEKQFYILENNPKIKACGCWLQAFGNDDKIIKHKEKHEQILVNMITHCSMSLGSVMLDRKWAENVLFDESKKHVEDYDFWSRIAWSGDFYNIQEVLYHYRIHEKQVSTVYNAVQKKGDVGIKLYLFRKLNYDVQKFDNAFLEKMFLQKGFFSTQEFELFLQWFQTVEEQNNKLKIYNQTEFNTIIKNYRRALIYKIYFHSNFCQIDKSWRIKALSKLSFSDMYFILKLKSKEKFKSKKINNLLTTKHKK